MFHPFHSVEQYDGAYMFPRSRERLVWTTTSAEVQLLYIYIYIYVFVLVCGVLSAQAWHNAKQTSI
jgi:hypothetical protein